MPDQDPDQQKPVEDQANQTLAQSVKALQERVRKMGVVLNRSDDTAFMDKASGDESGDAEDYQ
ncbi:hypothetical protein E4191_16025 (plasmid) [Paracoccus liaowanqingii]|uniref:Uncharacterized protein n=1 Tax=Paracoccus liaowanqingii TaxID=2560053 RepID=A0A4Y5SQA4_9RHOB|nr:hypothetical protein [Paracoccus liaowanqingii]QDA35680.1 hypothetical protein E4191_16025 [Paracoccus liaowanqingii]